MATLKSALLLCAASLVALEHEHGISPDNDHHKNLLQTLEDHGEEAGLSAEDIAEIKGEADAQRAAFGGEPKDAVPPGDGEG